MARYPPRRARAAGPPPRACPRARARTPWARRAPSRARPRTSPARRAPERAHRQVSGREVRKGRVRHVGGRRCRQDVPGSRPPEPDAAVRPVTSSRATEPSSGRCAWMKPRSWVPKAVPVTIRNRSAEPRHREVALDPAPGVQHRRVDDRADRPVDVVAAEPLEKAKGARAHDLELRERRLVEEPGPLARGTCSASIAGDQNRPANPRGRRRRPPPPRSARTSWAAPSRTSRRTPRRARGALGTRARAAGAGPPRAPGSGSGGRSTSGRSRGSGRG